jgi:hypothetical protein
MQRIAWVVPLGLLAAAVGPACHSSDTTPPVAAGTALKPAAASEARLIVGPGDTWLAQIALMSNASGQDVVLHDISFLSAGGQSTVAKVQATYAAPRPAGAADGWVPGGVFKTFPPSMIVPGRDSCNVQELTRVAGFTLKPGEEARAAFKMNATSSGSELFPVEQIEYSIGENNYAQTLPVGLRVESPSGFHLEPNKAEEPCVKKSNLLP